MQKGTMLNKQARKPEATKCEADRMAQKNKLRKTKRHIKQVSTNPKQQAKLITVASAAKTPHNSEAVAIFEEGDGDSEFLSQLVNSSQMQMSTHKNGSLFYTTDLPKKKKKNLKRIRRFQMV